MQVGTCGLVGFGTGVAGVLAVAVTLALGVGVPLADGDADDVADGEVDRELDGDVCGLLEPPEQPQIATNEDSTQTGTSRRTT